MVLSNRQRQSLNAAILQFLLDEGLNDSAAAFAKETSTPAEEAKKEAGTLEKKWTSVIRLQKRIMELEQEVSGLKEELESASSGGRRKKEGDGGSSLLALPRPPQKHVLKGHRGAVTCIAVHPVYSQTASGSEDASVKLWDYESGEYEKTLKGHTDVVQCVAYSPTGHMIASCSADLTIKLWETDGYNCVKTLKGHEHNVSCVTWMPAVAGKDQLLSSSRDKSIKVWDATTGFCLKTLQGHEEWVRRVRVHEKGLLIATCSNDKTVRVWRSDTGKVQSVFYGHSHVVEDVTFAPSHAEAKSGGGGGGGGQVLLASASRDKTIKVWEVNTEQLLFTYEGHDNWVRSLAFHPNGTYLISVSDDKSIIIWDLKLNREYKRYNGAHDHFITSVLMNPRDFITITGSVDNTIKVWVPS